MVWTVTLVSEIKIGFFFFFDLNIIVYQSSASLSILSTIYQSSISAV